MHPSHDQNSSLYIPRERRIYSEVLIFTALLFFALLPIPSKLTATEDLDLGIIVELLVDSTDDEFNLELLNGLHEGLKGRKNVKMPKPWPKAFANLKKSKNDKVRSLSLSIALIFDDPSALKELKKTLIDASAPLKDRKSALEALSAKKVKDLDRVLLKIIQKKPLRIPALKALASYNQPSIPKSILKLYPKLSAQEKPHAISTLSQRWEFATLLLSEVQAGKIKARDITAIHARQILNLNHDPTSQLLRKVWGDIRKTSAEKRQAINKYKKALTKKVLSKANLGRGRSFFDTTCRKCHRLFDTGATIGPELTGSNRADLDYILENILDPSAAIGKGYRLNRVITSGGRIISGLLKAKEPQRVTLQTENELITIPTEEILNIEESESSMMPEGLLNDLSFEEIRDLIAYLASDKEVPPQKPKPKEKK